MASRGAEGQHPSSIEPEKAGSRQLSEQGRRSAPVRMSQPNGG
jgi:hypothetical protein